MSLEEFCSLMKGVLFFQLLSLLLVHNLLEILSLSLFFDTLGPLVANLGE